MCLTAVNAKIPVFFGIAVVVEGFVHKWRSFLLQGRDLKQPTSSVEQATIQRVCEIVSKRGNVRTNLF